MSGSSSSSASAPKSRPGGVDFSVVADKRIEDSRFQREKAVAAVGANSKASATFAAFTRIAAGVDGRRLEDKISDPNRPTWDQYKKDNEDKMNMIGGDMRKMAEYRAQLDRERDRKMNQGSLMMKKSNHAISDDEDDNTNSSDESDNSDSGDAESDDENDERDGKSSKSKKEKKSKSKKEKSRKHKKEKSSKHKKSKKRKRRGDDDDVEEHKDSLKKEKCDADDA